MSERTKGRTIKIGEKIKKKQEKLFFRPIVTRLGRSLLSLNCISKQEAHARVFLYKAGPRIMMLMWCWRCMCSWAELSLEMA